MYVGMQIPYTGTCCLIPQICLKVVDREMGRFKDKPKTKSDQDCQCLDLTIDIKEEVNFSATKNNVIVMRKLCVCDTNIAVV